MTFEKFFASRQMKTGEPGWIAVFLGNPGVKYEKTRHNAGFMAADTLEKLESIKINRIKFNSLTGFLISRGEKAFVLKPQTYMNLSGEAVAPAAAFYKIPPERVIVIFDDINIAPGKIRLKRNGSDGGHNGIKSIIQHLGTSDFPRIKIGIGTPPNPGYNIIDWVIGKLTDNEFQQIKESAEKAVLALLEIMRSGVDSAMNKFN